MDLFRALASLWQQPYTSWHAISSIGCLSGLVLEEREKTNATDYIENTFGVSVRFHRSHFTRLFSVPPPTSISSSFVTFQMIFSSVFLPAPLSPFLMSRFDSFPRVGSSQQWSRLAEKGWDELKLMLLRPLPSCDALHGFHIWRKSSCCFASFEYFSYIYVYSRCCIRNVLNSHSRITLREFLLRQLSSAISSFASTLSKWKSNSAFFSFHPHTTPTLERDTNESQRQRV